jgi:transcriptional regulator
MYIPSYFRNSNHKTLLDFIVKNPFGILISNGSLVPDITHLSFVVEETNGGLQLIGHFSAANSHAQNLQNGYPVCIIFSGSDAY